MIKITNPTDCCGCTACASICTHNAITMQADKEGFLYPKVDAAKCVDCGLCNKACPLSARKVADLSPSYKELYAVRIKDKDVLMESSSGGAFSLFAENVIKNGGYVAGAVYNSEMEVVHAIASTMDEVALMRGSKYSQSRLDGIYVQVRTLLREGKRVLFSGTPCQVDGLRRFLMKDYENLLTMDVVCHAVPSPKIFKEYIRFAEKKLDSKIVSLAMRDKRSWGWSHNFAYRFSLKNGKRSADPEGLLKWSRLYFSMLIDRPSCHNCLYTNYHRASDITVADFWDDNKRRPDIYSKDGTSLLILNTEKGIDAFQRVKDNCHCWEITKEESWQPCLEHPTIVNPKREKFWKYYYKHSFEKAYYKFFDDSIYVKFKKLVKRIIGYERKN